MPTTLELAEKIKKYHCDASVYLDYMIYKANLSELCYDEDIEVLDIKLEELKESLYKTANEIKPNPANVGPGVSKVPLAEYLDLLELKTICENLDRYVDSIIYYMDWIAEDPEWTE